MADEADDDDDDDDDGSWEDYYPLITIQGHHFDCTIRG